MDLTKENKLSTSFANAPRVVTQKIEEPTKRRPRQGYKIRQASSRIESGLPPAAVVTHEDAIVLDKLPELDLANYIDAMSSKVAWADEIEPSSVCLFLSDAKEASRQHGRCLQVGDYSLFMRPLLKTPLVRVLATNVLPFITGATIDRYLSHRYGIKVKYWVHLETDKDEGSNSNPSNTSDPSKPRPFVVSFARHLYVEPQDIPKFPARITGIMKNWPYSIYFGSEEHWCDSCQRVGHLKSNCANPLMPKHIGAPPADNNGTDPSPAKNNGTDPPLANNNGIDTPFSEINGTDSPPTNNIGTDPPPSENDGTDPPSTPTKAIGIVPPNLTTPPSQITHNESEGVFLSPNNLNSLPLASIRKSPPSIMQKMKNKFKSFPFGSNRSRPSSRDTSPRSSAALEETSTTPRTSPYASYENSAPQDLSSPSNAAHVAGPSRTETSPPTNPGIRVTELGSPPTPQQHWTMKQPPTTPPVPSPRRSGSMAQLANAICNLSDPRCGGGDISSISSRSSSPTESTHSFTKRPLSYQELPHRQQ